MFDFTYELEQLEKGDRSPDLIKKILEKHDKRAAEMKSLYERYKTKDLPIFKRELEDPMKVNNQVNNDFFSEIIDTKVGYFAGVPVSYTVEEKDDANDAIQEFSTRNRVADLDAEATKWAAICGYAARLVYVDESGKEKTINVPPWEAILIGENGMDEPKYALRPYKASLGDKEELRVELYEAGKMTEYRGENESSLKEFEESAHVFDVCPMFGIMNNEELLGDAEKVLALIDAYDRSVSDVNSEIEAFRSAYLAFYGVEPPDEEEEQSFANAGTMYFRDGQKGEFITKVIQDTAVENHLNRLHNNIYRFSSTPDMADEAFAGNTSGVAMKFKILALENKASTFERKFKSGCIRMFEILSSAWSKRRIQIDPYKIDMKFTRNFPLDLLYEAQASVQLKGMVSEETRLGLLSFVDNPQDEAKALEAEKEAYMEDMMGGVADESVGGTRPTDTKEAI